MDRLEVIQKIADKAGCNTYLEIGVRYGSVFLEVDAPKKIGVDPNFQIPFFKKMLSAKDFFRNKYFRRTSDDFFAEDSSIFEKEKIDIAFIDGLHTYGQSLKDVKNCLKHLNEGGVIIMHDCNPVTEAMAAPSFEAFTAMPYRGKAWCGDVWKTIAHIRSACGDINAFVLDCDYGLGIITGGAPENRLEYGMDEIEKMGYDELSRNRKEILNLKDPDYLYEFISKLR